jgi:hypothetical protein
MPPDSPLPPRFPDDFMPDDTDYRDVGVAESRHLKPGSRNYRAFVGSPGLYDVTAAMQFMVMTALGLREWHKLLDIGCGSLRGGRLFIAYLRPDRYFGIEPNAWLIEDAIRYEIGPDMIYIKRPTFDHNSDFTLTVFGEEFHYMVAQSILTHVSQAQMDRCFSQAKLALKPQGFFAANFFANGDEIYDGDVWSYPRFASYPIKFVMAKAREHGLSAHPLIWANAHDHYWMVFVHDDYAEQVPWLGKLNDDQRLFRILQLEKHLNDAKTGAKIANAKLKRTEEELAKFKSADRKHLRPPEQRIQPTRRKNPPKRRISR